VSSPALDVANARVLFASWQIALRAARLAPGTIKTYGDGVNQYLAWCEANDVAPMVRANLGLWIAGLLDDGAAPATARTRQLGVRRFAKWLAAEGELPSDPFLGLPPPKLDETVIEPLTDDELRAMLKACVPGKGATFSEIFRGRRDEALLRFMLETGTRAGEVVALAVDDVDLSHGTAIVRRGKGGKGRSVPFGPDAALALDRYLRLRRSHRLADSAELWLGDRGKRFTYPALHFALRGRAEAAAIIGFHPHRMRHTAAHRWLAKGGSEGGLMAVAGWSNSAMLHRYSKAQASARAAEEARGLNLGEL
jgi:integrase